MTRIIISVIGLFLFIGLFASLFDQKKMQSGANGDANGVSIAKITDTKPASKPWEPEVFDHRNIIQKGAHLPASYSGQDPVKFFEAFKSQIDAIPSKGEFETSDDYKKRIYNLGDLLGKFNKKYTYAFSLENIDIQYDSEAKIYKFGRENTSSSFVASPTYDGYVDTEKDKYITFVLKTTENTDKYVGNNSFGVSKVITRVRGNIISLAINPSNSIFKKVFEKNYLVYKGKNDSWCYFYRDQIAIQIEKAREIKKDINILLIGNVSGSKLIRCSGVSREPTIDNPYDIFKQCYGIPFDVKRIIYYHFGTGEILDVRNFDDNNNSGKVTDKDKLTNNK